ALVAAGALTGALASTRRTSVRLSMVVGTAAALGIVQALAGFAPGELAFGMLLIGVGVGASRWSWFALVLPAMVLLVLSLINVLSLALYAAGPRDIAQPTGTFLILGGGVAVAVA
ncbi:hypothetical protein, partial [Variovorax sp. 22077]|uniref:hypothetical protein n=1 Tax=Variovorax sp. 22077 TaxID=3453867 RepID=UPI003F8331C4